MSNRSYNGMSTDPEDTIDSGFSPYIGSVSSSQVPPTSPTSAPSFDFKVILLRAKVKQIQTSDRDGNSTEKLFNYS